MRRESPYATDLSVRIAARLFLGLAVGRAEHRENANAAASGWPTAGHARSKGRSAARRCPSLFHRMRSCDCQLPAGCRSAPSASGGPPSFIVDASRRARRTVGVSAVDFILSQRGYR
jgi:hypothetical protein